MDAGVRSIPSASPKPIANLNRSHNSIARENGPEGSFFFGLDRPANCTLWGSLNPPSYEQRVLRLGKLKAEIAHGGASLAAARYILDQLRKNRPTVPQPHFLPTAADQSLPATTGMVDAEIAG